MPIGQGEVIAPNKVQATDGPLPKGPIDVKVVYVHHENPVIEETNFGPDDSENWEVRVEYPNGSIGVHTISKKGDLAHLIPKIRNKLRSHHGVFKDEETGIAHDAGELITRLPKKVEDLNGMVLTFAGEK